MIRVGLRKGRATSGQCLGRVTGGGGRVIGAVSVQGLGRKTGTVSDYVQNSSEALSESENFI